jgi:hypothetical protein
MANLYEQSNTYLSDLENEKNRLGKKKYGNAYDPTLDWTKQKGTITPNWSQVDEDNAKLWLQDYETRRLYTQGLQSQAQNLYGSANTQKAQLGVQNDIVRKYMGNNLRASGQNTSGMAETTQAQFANNYLNNLSNVNLQTRQNETDLLNAYTNKDQEFKNAYLQGSNENQARYDTALSNEMQTTLNTMAQGGYLNENTYNNLRKQYADNGLSQQTLGQLDKTYLQYLDNAQAKAKYDISANEQGININMINKNDFSGNSEQTQYVNEVVNRIQANPQAYNGKIVGFNFGAEKAKYLVYNGMLYKVNGNEKIDNEFKQIENDIKSKRKGEPVNWIVSGGI